MFKIGTDPELFLVKNGKFISAEDGRGPIIPGTKSHPFKVKGGAIQVDGVAAEFNVNPSEKFEDYYSNLKKVVLELRRMIHIKDPDISLRAVPTATFDREYFDNLPTKTKKLGCDPDFNAYTGKPNNPPETDEPFRTGSGHIHIGWTKDQDPNGEGHMLDCCLVSKAMDNYLYQASKIWDKDNKRRRLYGKKGCFRPKPYGMEYRTLSNAWVSDPRLVKTVFDLTMYVMKRVDSGKMNLNYKITPKKLDDLYMI
jgi:hypothetical protein